jgi:prespore-specific regulator
MGLKKNWTEDEDLLLAEILINHAKTGEDQARAFEIASQKLSRTSAACAYRWRITVKKTFEQEYLEAREKGVQNINNQNTTIVTQQIVKSNENHSSIKKEQNLIDNEERKESNEQLFFRVLYEKIQDLDTANFLLHEKISGLETNNLNFKKTIEKQNNEITKLKVSLSQIQNELFILNKNTGGK